MPVRVIVSLTVWDRAMAQITFVLPDGERRIIDAKAGESVMDAAIRHNIPGIEAECGGGCTCATCHIYIDGDWSKALGSFGGLLAPGDASAASQPRTAAMISSAVPATGRRALTRRTLARPTRPGATGRAPDRTCLDHVSWPPPPTG